jgi:elongation of very long chain fatty acids protein 4
VYYAQKFLEFGDTLFFVLRTRFRQLTLLHVYHHVSITLVTALFLRYDMNADDYLPAAANSLVHVLMYSHYLLSAFGVDCWWKKQLTTLQLIQFCGVLAQTALAAARGRACGYPEWLKAVMIAYQVSMLALFGAFFVNSYLGARRRRIEKGKAKAL